MTAQTSSVPGEDKLAKVAQVAGEKLGDALLEAFVATGELTLVVKREAILDVLKTLRDDEAFLFKSLQDVCGVDYPDRPERFDVVYHLLSYKHNLRIRVKLTTDESQPVASATGLFPSANWFEREVWDMYGVLFEGHPDLRRILTDYGFQGFPLRKDFPLTGYVEVRYSEEHKRVIFERVDLRQDFRHFDFLSPWEGAQYILPGDEKAAEKKQG